MKKLSRDEMKNVVGGKPAGGSTTCVTCSDTPGYWNQHGNVMCSANPSGMTCHDTYGTGTNGILCSNLNTGEVSYSGCPVV